MEKIIIANLFIFIVVSIIATYIGLDLKKRSSWFFCLYAFGSGFLLIFMNNGQFSSSFMTGALFAFVTMFTGVMTHLQRQRL